MDPEQDANNAVEESSTNTIVADDNDQQDLMLAAKETNRVKRSKWLVLFALLVAAGTTSYLAFRLTHQQEMDEFERDGEILAAEIIEVAHEHLRSLLQVSRSLSTAITRQALNINNNYDPTMNSMPNMTTWSTLPFWQVLAQEAQAQAGPDIVAWAPLVATEDRTAWETYAMANQNWIASSQHFFEHHQTENLQHDGHDKEAEEDEAVWEPIHPMITTLPEWELLDHEEEDEEHGEEHHHELDLFHAPLWQVGGSAVDTSGINLDLLTHPTFRRLIGEMLETRQPVLSEAINVAFLDPHYHNDEEGEDGHDHRRRFVEEDEEEHHDDEDNDEEDHEHEDDHQEDHEEHELDADHDVHEPHAFMLYPVFSDLEGGSILSGFVITVFPMGLMFQSQGLIRKMVAVLSDSCGYDYTYVLELHGAQYLKHIDLHDHHFDHLGVHAELNIAAANSLGDRDDLIHDDDSHGHEEYEEGKCTFSFNIFPSKELEDEYLTLTPVVYALVVFAIFMFTILVFKLYDYLVESRQQKVLRTAKNANTIVRSLFPQDVQDRLMKDAEKQAAQTSANERAKINSRSATSKVDDFLDNNEDNDDDVADGNPYDTPAIAYLYPAVSVMMGDLKGFTSWSSVRDPSQVFYLLETVYHAFDIIAKRRRIFKVETIGDSYVACAGVPEARKDHAVAICRFAWECNHQMNIIVKKLESTLGEGTAQLQMRFGIHSGPIVAGVLRGEKARFQLFGDTINTASRLESNGQGGRIHVSEETANLLMAAGKNSWVTPRDGTITVKGKAAPMQTYWVKLSADSVNGSSETRSTISSNEYPKVTDCSSNLVNQNVDMIIGLLKKIAASRGADNSSSEVVVDEGKFASTTNSTSFDELADVIALPKFDPEAAKRSSCMEEIELDPRVEEEVRNYVLAVESIYRNNEFHCFEHASHVAASVFRMVSLDEDKVLALRDHAQVIAGDPLTQFSCVVSALIHDVDHTGVPNAQLINENHALAVMYKNKSVAEQNSIEVGWSLLMDETYQNFRKAIYSNEEEFARFRQLVVQVVLATDIMDKQLKSERNARWEAAFNKEDTVHNPDELINRRATIVLEHFIQASDVVHTMQHWQTFRKWNERFFLECYKAYQEGRAHTDPSQNWYAGEIGFFDFYIIPLARKLTEFGDSSAGSEYLSHAQKNREQWVAHGQMIVAEMVQKVQSTKRD